MKPFTIEELASRYGISTRTLKRWKSKGVDIHDTAAVHAHRAGLAHSGTVAQSTAPGRPKDTTAPDYHFERARWKRAQAEKAEIEAAKMAGSVVDAGTIAADVARLAYATRQALLNMVGELPPLLYGMETPAIAKELQRAVDGVLRRLHDESAYLTPTGTECPAK